MLEYSLGGVVAVIIVIYLVYAYLHPADVHKDMRRMRGKG